MLLLKLNWRRFFRFFREIKGRVFVLLFSNFISFQDFILYGGGKFVLGKVSYLYRILGFRLELFLFYYKCDLFRFIYSVYKLVCSRGSVYRGFFFQLGVFYSWFGFFYGVLLICFLVLCEVLVSIIFYRVMFQNIYLIVYYF